MKKRSFKSWLFGQYRRNDIVGHLAQEFRSDYQSHYTDEQPLPRRFTYETAREYLESINACPGALRALEAAYREWSAESQRPARGGEYIPWPSVIEVRA